MRRGYLRTTHFRHRARAISFVSDAEGFALGFASRMQPALVPTPGQCQDAVRQCSSVYLQTAIFVDSCGWEPLGVGTNRERNRILALLCEGPPTQNSMISGYSDPWKLVFIFHDTRIFQKYEKSIGTILGKTVFVNMGISNFENA